MKRPHKYRAQACEARDGTRFASKRERNYYEGLLLRQRAGEISHMELQPEFPIVIDGSAVRAVRGKDGRKGKHIKYTADFAFFDNLEGRRRIIDCKGMDTEASRFKRAIVQHIYRIEVELA